MTVNDDFSASAFCFDLEITLNSRIALLCCTERVMKMTKKSNYIDSRKK